MLKFIKKLISFILKLILILLVLLLIAVGVAYYYAGHIVKTAVEEFVPEITKTSVKLNDVDISLLKGRVALNGLSIGNPDGYGAKEAFGLKNIVVTFDPKTITENKIVINQILIEGTHVSAEATYQNGKISSNLTDLQNNVNAYLAKSSSPAETKKETTPSSTSSKQVVIRDLQINDSSLTVGIMKQTIDIPLPNIQQKNIGEQKKKMTWKDTIAYIFNLITTESVKNTVTATQKALKDGALKLLDSAENAKKALKEQAGNVLDSANSLKDGVKGLFSK